MKRRVFSFKFVNKYYSTLDPLQCTGTLVVKGKGLSRSRRTPHTPGNREYSTARLARHIAREGVLPSIFTFMWDRSGANRLSANRTPPVGLENRNDEGKI